MAIATDPTDPNFGLETDQNSPNFGLTVEEPPKPEGGGVQEAIQQGLGLASQLYMGAIGGWHKLTQAPGITRLEEAPLLPTETAKSIASVAFGKNALSDLIGETAAGFTSPENLALLAIPGAVEAGGPLKSIPRSLTEIFKGKAPEAMPQTPEVLPSEIAGQQTEPIIQQTIGGEINAEQPSYAQVGPRETPLGIETRPEGEIPVPSGGYNVVGEAQGAAARGEIPRAEAQGQEVAPVPQPEQPAVQIRAAVDRMDFGEQHAGASELASDLEKVKNLPQPLKKALDDFREAQVVDREEYGERSGLVSEHGDILESEARKWASPETPVEPVSPAAESTIDVSPLLNAKSDAEAAPIVGDLMIKAKTQADISKIRDAYDQWKSKSAAEPLPKTEAAVPPTTPEAIDVTPEVPTGGVSAARLEERPINAPPPGEGVGWQETRDFGNQWLDKGGDINKVIADFNRTGKLNEWEVGKGAAYLERLQSVTDRAEDALRENPNDPVLQNQHAVALAQEQRFTDAYRPMATTASSALKGFQGKVPLTDDMADSVSALSRKYGEIQGKQMTPEEVVKADRIAKQNAKAKADTQAATSELYRTADVEYGRIKTTRTGPPTLEDLGRIFGEKLKEVCET